MAGDPTGAGEEPIFRTKSLERLSTPDRLDQLLRVVKRRSWVPLAAVGALLLLGLLWACLGRVPVTVEGTAVLVRPRQVVPVQAGAGGDVLALGVQVGDTVQQGQPIATLHVPDVARRLTAEQGRLEAFLARSKRLAGFNAERTRKEQAFLDGQRARLEGRLASLRGNAEDARIAARIEDLSAELERNRMAAHRAAARLEEARILEASSAEEIRANIARLKAEQAARSQVLANRTGTVLELTISVGSTVTEGRRIATLAVADSREPLVALAYFDVADGKRIQTGMRARVSPVTVRRERHGSMQADVTRVSAYPVTTDAVLNQVGNRHVAESLVGGRSRIEVHAALALEPTTASGFRWTSSRGPDQPITAGTGARVTVTIEERAPITLLIPALRGWLGLD